MLARWGSSWKWAKTPHRRVPTRGGPVVVDKMPQIKLENLQTPEDETQWMREETETNKAETSMTDNEAVNKPHTPRPTVEVENRDHKTPVLSYLKIAENNLHALFYDGPRSKFVCSKPYIKDGHHLEPCAASRRRCQRRS